MKTKQMTRWGVGPKFAVISIIYSAIVFIVQNKIFPEFRSVIYSSIINFIIGIVLIIIGLIILIIPSLTIDKYFFAGKLCKKGVYAYLRHPIYASWISFIIPGIAVGRSRK